MSLVHILGVPFDPVTSSQANERILAYLKEEKNHHVMTPNNEMLVEANRNTEFLSVLQSSTLNIPDSTGIIWAAHWTHQKLPERVTGVDTVERLCKELGNDQPVFLLGAREGIALRASHELQKKNLMLNVVGTHAGSPKDEDAEHIITMINASGAHLLLVAFGAPQQDLWIAKYYEKLTTVRVAMGVGGTFDFLAGVQKRAPQWMQKSGLEWLWRLVKQPSRVGRITTALITFPLLVIMRGRSK